ncbi:KipI antagonist [Clostridium sp. C105KSO13]|nr:KipI antagonist [Clostridium sp. C105KSO13]
MNSKSTLMRNHLGGVSGRKLKRGDKIGFLNPKTQLLYMEKRKMEQELFPQKDIILRVVTGPQDYEFSEEEIRSFFSSRAEITQEFDRMGCRLKRKEPLKHKGDGNIISDGVAFGSIQIPTNGQPIIMLADRQTTGGYTKLGTVISVDIPKLAQSVPGRQVRFIRVGIHLAQDLYLKQLREIKRLEKELGQNS